MTEYNGWPSYETWSAHMWLTEDGGRPWFARGEAALAHRNGDRRAATEDLARDLRQWHEEREPLTEGASFWSDILSRALARVDWRRLAEAFLPEDD